jgi:Protein of unknown function (DUF4199)
MENQTTTTRTALKWGVILGIIFIIYSTGIMVSGQLGNKTFSYLSFIILGGGIFFGMREFKTENLGFMSFGQGLGLGTLMSVISSMISGFYSTAYTKFIDPTIPDQMIKIQISEMEKRGMSDDQIEQALEMTQIFRNPGFSFIFVLFITVLTGFVLSLIITAIIKKDKPVFD